MPARSSSAPETFSHKVLIAVPTLRMRPDLPSSVTRCEKSPLTAACTMPPTAASNSPLSRVIAASRSLAMWRSCSDCAAASRCAFSAALILKPSTAEAMAPISSLRPSPGRTTPKSPSASLRIDAVSLCSGEMTRSDTSINMPITKTIAAAISAKLKDEIAAGARILRGGMVLRRIESRVGDALEGRHPGDRQRRPLLDRYCRSLTCDERFEGVGARVDVIGIEEIMLDFLHRLVDSARGSGRPRAMSLI